MDYLEIQGGGKLSGSVKISGAKNAALPLLALSLLSKNDMNLYNLPNVADINTFCALLEMLGAEIQNLDSKNHTNITPPFVVEQGRRNTNANQEEGNANANKDSIESKKSLAKGGATTKLDSNARHITLNMTNDSQNLDSKNPHNKKINTNSINSTKAVYDIVRKMRASILVLGPLLTRFGHCEVSLPGGCAIGARPVDLHIKAMQKLGASIQVKGGYILAQAKKGLKGADIVFDKISVTGSSNAIMAAALARGKSRIINAAREPEVVQICEALRDAGLEIEGIGTPEIRITGSDGELLDFKDICVIPDRIEAGTYLCAGAITNSQITIEGVIEEHIESILTKLQEIGFKMKCSKVFGENLSNIELLPAKKLLPFRITTTEYPGFPTDMQAQFMALSTQCEGSSFIKETLFENRFMHANELQRLGADITIDSNVAQINGKCELIGADVMATDLRASSALVLAALVAKGSTKIHRIYHLDRGYESIESKLSDLGVKVKRARE